MILIMSIVVLLGSAPARPALHPVPAFQGTAEPCIVRQSRNRSTSINNDRDSYSMKYSAADCRGDVQIEGKLRYSQDFEHITGISAGGSIRIEETDHGTRRRLEAEPSGSGLSYRWSVDGRERPFDAEAKQWFDAWTLMMFRELGFAAEERAQAMLRAGGADAIVREVGQMTSDYVQATYLGVALEEGRLDASGVERVLGVAAKELDSDYYMSTTLTRAAKGIEFNDRARRSYLAATAKMSSDYYKEQVLSGLLANGRLDGSDMSEILRQATMIGSDYYQLNLLQKVLSRKLTDEQLETVLKAGRQMSSDYYEAELLTQIARKYELRGSTREAFMTNLDRIESSYYRSNVQSAMRAR